MYTYNQSPILWWVCEKPNPSGAGRRMCHSMSVLLPSTLRRTCTEHKPGHLHAATRWTHTATATPLQPTHTNVMTNVNGMYLCDFYVQFLHFDSVSAKSVTVKLTIYIYIPKKIHKIVFSPWNVKVSGVYNLSEN